MIGTLRVVEQIRNGFEFEHHLLIFGLIADIVEVFMLDGFGGSHPFYRRVLQNFCN
jgi:hypothetical protein